jgi:hypothetical protein
MTKTTEYDKKFQDKYGNDIPKGDGDCFDKAVEVAERFEKDYPDVLIVHGEPIGTGGEALGVRFPHAWVELDLNGFALVIDESNGNDVTISRDFYYAFGNIVEADVVRYTLTEARIQMLKHKHYGPWHW